MILMSDVKLLPGETLEDLQFQGLRFIQKEGVLKFGTDAVILSSFIELRSGETLVDLCTGSGIIPVLLSGRVRAEILGVEIQSEAAALARRNAELNGLSNIRIVEGDLKDIKKHVRRADAVSVNPPYDKPGTGDVSENKSLRIARHEVACTLEDVVKSAAGILQDGGRFYMIHRAARLPEIIVKMKKYLLEPKALRPVARRAGEEPGYILIKGVKRGGEGLRFLPPLHLFEGGEYTPELKKIYHLEG